MKNKKKQFNEGERKGEDDLHTCGPVWKLKENN